MSLPFSHPWILIPTAVLALLALGGGLWAQTRPGASLRVVGQRPWQLGLGSALMLAGLGVGLAEPRWGLPEVPRLTVHVVVDASRSMGVRDSAGHTRWEAACALLDQLWSDPIPGVRYGLDLLTGDAISLLPPGEDTGLLKDALSTVAVGDLGSVGSSFGKALPQVADTVDPKTPAMILLLSDGEETWERLEEAQARASQGLRDHHLPLYAMAFGSEVPQPVKAGEGGIQMSQANPTALAALAEASGGRRLSSLTELRGTVEGLAKGNLPMPTARSLTPGRPEWGAWLALLGLGIWLVGAGRPLRAWRSVLGACLLFGLPAQAQMPLPSSVEAWLAQTALDRGDVPAARRWRPRGELPLHRLLAAQVDLRGEDPARALKTLEPLLGQGVPRPVPAWRAPALLLAARAQVSLGRPDEAITMLERLLGEMPGHPEAVHNLQTLVRNTTPPPPDPKKPPPPPPPRPSMGARQDELEGMKQRQPQKPKPQGGVKDI